MSCILSVSLRLYSVSLLPDSDVSFVFVSTLCVASYFFRKKNSGIDEQAYAGNLSCLITNLLVLSYYAKLALFIRNAGLNFRVVPSKIMDCLFCQFHDHAEL